MDFQLQASITFVCAIFAFLLCLFYLSSKNIHGNPNRKKAAPEPAGAWPLIGHLHLLAGSGLPHVTLATMADKYGPIFTIRLGFNRTLVVSNSEMAKDCLLTNDVVFCSRSKVVAGEHLGYNYAMFGFGPYGPYWREVRKITILQLLSNQRLEMLKTIRETLVNESIKEIHGKSASNKGKIDLKRWFADVTLRVVLKVVVGNRYSTEAGEEWDNCKRVLREFFELAGSFVPADHLPFLRWMDIGGYEKKMRSIAKEMDTMAQGWLDMHKQRLNSGLTPGEQDFMDVMLRILGEDDQSLQGYSADKTVKATCLALILGGTDTTTVTLTWALSLLLNHPNVLKKAQEELDFHIGKERKVNLSEVKNLLYLQAVIKETLRLYPAAPLTFQHESMADCVVGGYHVQPGTHLVVNLWKIHRDPRVWSDLHEFRPERFLTTHKDVDPRGQHFEFIPFGSGRRMCPGISFALQSVQLILASLLQSFEISTQLDEAVDMTEDFGLTSIKATPLEVLLTPRLPLEMYG